MWAGDWIWCDESWTIRTDLVWWWYLRICYCGIRDSALSFNIVFRILLISKSSKKTFEFASFAEGFWVPWLYAALYGTIQLSDGVQKDVSFHLKLGTVLVRALLISNSVASTFENAISTWLIISHLWDLLMWLAVGYQEDIRTFLFIFLNLQPIPECFGDGLFTS